jgi:hypothetical protein
MAYSNAIIVMVEFCYQKQFVYMLNKIENEIVVWPADDPNQRTIGWVIYEKIEKCIITESAKNILSGHKKVKCVLIE